MVFLSYNFKLHNFRIISKSFKENTYFLDTLESNLFSQCMYNVCSRGFNHTTGSTPDATE